MLGAPLFAITTALAQPKEILPLSVTNKFGDVFTNPAVAAVLPDGLLLESRGGQLKVRFENLPADVRQQYRSRAVMAAADARRERENAGVAADFLAQQEQLRAEAERVREAKSQRSDPANVSPRADVPKHEDLTRGTVGVFNGGQITYLLAGTSEWTHSTPLEGRRFEIRPYPGTNGFAMQITCERWQTNGTGTHEQAGHYFWAKRADDPAIEKSSVRTESKNRFVKVSYRIDGARAADFYFAFREQWVEVHVTKTPAGPDDAKLFADFEKCLSYE